MLEKVASPWLAACVTLLTSFLPTVLRYSDMDGLEQSIEAAYSIASQRLFDIFFDKFRLTTHIRALRDYLLLGKGDFVELLMDNLGPSMGKSANSLMRHQLTACLETALRGSTAANDDADVLRRLDARMNEYSQGQVGWDCFTLEYKVDAPVDTVLSPTAMSQYERLFSQLWRTRRVEVAVDGAWMRLMTGSRTFQSLSRESEKKALDLLFVNFSPTWLSQTRFTARPTSRLPQSSRGSRRDGSLRAADPILLSPGSDGMLVASFGERSPEERRRLGLSHRGAQRVSEPDGQQGPLAVS